MIPVQCIVSFVNVYEVQLSKLGSQSDLEAILNP